MDGFISLASVKQKNFSFNYTLFLFHVPYNKRRNVCYIMKHDALKKLAEKILQGKASPEEISLYNQWFESFQNADDITLEDPELKKARLMSRIQESLSHKKVVPVRKIISVAAAVLILFGAGSYYLFNNYHHKIPAAQKNGIAISDIAPGGNHATLTLANGKTILLDQTGNGNIASQAGSNIIKQQNGLIAYQNNTTISGITPALNQLSTPRGGQYRLALSDGTKVWLNAASSIRFPSSFTGKERVVEISGEAYFEVVHDAVHPFKVITRGQTVEDLGTRFDINAYEDNPAVVTTLAEGKISIRMTGKPVLLKPGQQAIVHPEAENIQVQPADIALSLAWKNGYFQFDHADLHTVLRELARWYDVKVAYGSNPSGFEFSGKIHRNIDLSEALEILKYTGVHFTIQDRTIIVNQ